MDASAAYIQTAGTKNDLRDNRQVTKDLDVGLISADTILRMIRFLGIESNGANMEVKLNKQRVENKRTEPGVPKKAERLGTIIEGNEALEHTKNKGRSAQKQRYGNSLSKLS